MRILVRATNWLGDAIMCLPAMEALRAAHPSAKITVLGLPWLRDLYGGESFCDEVIAYPTERGLKNLKGKRRLALALRGHFDVAILMQNAFEAAAFAYAAGVPQRVGYDRDGRGWLLTDAIELPVIGHERFYYLELLRRSGWIPGYDAEAPIRLRGVKPKEFGKRVIGVSPGAAFGTAKRWFPERFAEAAALVALERGASVALFGSANEQDIVGVVERELTARGIAVVNYAGRTGLREFIELCAGCELMLTNDSGAMHVAYAVGTPSVTVFGSTDPIGTGPVGERAVIVREAVSCSPCKLRECPIDHRCMTRISAERVALTAISLLK
ncbi:glycosyltransferase family 9 protein [Bryobacter aggregatus]|uniref:glycosyltransferase family 9 protein n=1 Tax=Bryobacter aggregatus TaxID=360054 RepID=UPI0004E0C62B|nr:glycosyltransferase family 9 protein [Bryobacter aggregatus]